ncbi:hypothetical protein ON010_g14964 [Phytophthora cinnamomi]|nr:hypothetical protein ON010_g14964 [Phytophthora cinnamomi]
MWPCTVTEGTVNVDEDVGENIDDFHSALGADDLDAHLLSLDETVDMDPPPLRHGATDQDVTPDSASPCAKPPRASTRWGSPLRSTPAPPGPRPSASADSTDRWTHADPGVASMPPHRRAKGKDTMGPAPRNSRRMSHGKAPPHVRHADKLPADATDRTPRSAPWGVADGPAGAALARIDPLPPAPGTDSGADHAASASARTPTAPSPLAPAPSPTEPPGPTYPTAAAPAGSTLPESTREATTELARTALEWTLQFDGACRGRQPKMAGAGALLYNSQGTATWTDSVHLAGVQRNNTTEYQALLARVEAAVAHGCRVLRIEGDSALVIAQVKGEFPCSNTRLRGYRNRIRRGRTADDGMPDDGAAATDSDNVTEPDGAIRSDRLAAGCLPLSGIMRCGLAAVSSAGMVGA